MQIHVGRNGQQLGQFSVEEINRKLADGTFSPTDLGWYEGAAGWAPLSSIAGVTLPGGPAIPVPPPPAPAAAPEPLPMPSAPHTRPLQASVGAIAPQPAQSHKGMVVASWILLGLTALLSIIPVLGFAAWFLALAVVPITFILGIVILGRGGKTQGIIILVASVVVLPVFILVASLASTLILGATVSEHEKTQQDQIIENLRTLSEAKAKWVAQTRVTEGTKVTVAGLAPYLDGKEVKSIVGEIYDPRPVGQEPTATLPATKSLAQHEKGAVLTLSGSQLLDGERSSSRIRETEGDDEPSPIPSPQKL